MENLLNHCIFASYLVKKILLKMIHLYFLTKEIIKGALMHYIITFNKMEDKTHFWWVKKSHFFYIKSLLKISNLISMKVLLQSVSYYYMEKRNIVLSQPDNKWLCITYFIFWLIRRGTAVYNLDFGMPG